MPHRQRHNSGFVLIEVLEALSRKSKRGYANRTGGPGERMLSRWATRAHEKFRELPPIRDDAVSFASFICRAEFIPLFSFATKSSKC